MTSTSTTKLLQQTAIFLTVFLLVQFFRNQDTQVMFANTVFTYQEIVCGDDNPEGVTVTASQRQSTQDFIDQVKIVSPDFGVTYAVNNKEFDTSKLIPAVIRTSAVWWLLMIFSIFGSFSYSYSACCPNSCPCCHCCRRDFSKGDPEYTKCELIMPSLIAVVFSVIVIITASIGLAYAPGVANGIKSMRCQFITSLADIVEPYNATNTYPGISGLKYRLSNISTNLSSFQQQVDSTFNVDRPTNMKNTQSQTLTVVASKKTTAQSFSSYSSNPQATSSAVTSYFGTDQDLFYYMVATSQQSFQSSYATFQPYVPLNEYTTLKSFYDIQVQIMTQLNNAVQPFKKSLNFEAALQVGIDQANVVTADVDKVSGDMYDFTSPMGQYADNVTQALQGLYAVALAFSVFIAASILIVSITKRYGFRRLIHMGWCVYSIVMILGFFLGAILNPASVISLQFCDYLESFIHDESFFQSSTLITEGQTKIILQECFFGKGDILKILNITDASSKLKTLVTTISDFQTQSQEILKTGVSNTSQYLDQQTYIIGGIKNGTYGDFNDTKTTGVGPLLASFNGNTGSGCIEIAQTVCADNKTIPSQTKTSSSCWHPYLLTKTSNYASFMCSAQQSDGTKLYNWFTQQGTIWNQALTDQQDIVSQHDSTQTSFTSYLNEVNTFIQGTVDFVDYNADPNTGIAQAMNCSVITTYFDKLYDVTCVLFVPQVYRATIIIITISVAMFVGSCASACAGVRFFRMEEWVQKQNQISKNKVQPDEKSIIDDETQHLKQTNRDGNPIQINRLNTQHDNDPPLPIQQVHIEPEEEALVQEEVRLPSVERDQYQPQQEEQQDQQDKQDQQNDEVIPLDE